jgi:lysophospholipase L1-like esterase
MRRLLVLMAVAMLAGCSGQPAVPDTPVQPTAPRPSLPPIVHYHRVVLIGDSYTEGSGEGGQRGHGWPALVVADLRTQGVLVSPALAAEGSAGYVAASWKGETFGDIARRVVDRDTELVVFFGSANDVAFPPERIGAAALEAFTSVRAAAPAAKLLVIGPVWPGPNPPEAFLNVRNAARAQAQTVGAVFVDPIADGWLADTPELIGADRFHPNDEGHKYLAARIAPLIRNALG